MKTMATDLTKLKTTNYEIIVSCGKYFNALAVKGNKMPADKRISISGDFSYEDLLGFAQQIAYSTFNEKATRLAEKMESGARMADGVGNAFIYDADLNELLCGVEINFEGKEITTEIHSTTLEPNLGKPIEFSKFHR